MGAFELSTQSLCCDNSANNTTFEDCIIAYKIYDQCRIQECLTGEMIGPARAAENSTCCGLPIREGDVVVPPPNATSVSIRDLDLCKIIILSKTPNPVRCGYWDIEVKYVFGYTLVFRAAGGQKICCIDATSSYNLKLTLFGSTTTDVVVTNDMFNHTGMCPGTGPFVSVEGKGVALAADLKYPKTCSNNCNCCCNNCNCVDDCKCGCCYDESAVNAEATSVCVTIGLYSIIKVFHQVNVLAHTSGICIPGECANTSAEGCPCDIFNELEFPMDIFSPPTKLKSGDCDCSCGCDRR